jgi:hypothetical protein
MAKIKNQGSGGPKVSTLKAKQGGRRAAVKKGNTGWLGAAFSYVFGQGGAPGEPDVRYDDPSDV